MNPQNRSDVAGYIASYDPDTMTAYVISSDGSSEYRDCGISLNSMDPGSGAYSFNPPSVGAPCLISVVNGDPIVKLLYSQPHLASTGKTKPGFQEDTLDNTDEVATKSQANFNRAPPDAPNKSTLPGDWVITGPSGSKVGFYDKLFSVKISDTFYSVWNSLNKFFDTLCDRLRFRSPGADVYVDSSENGDSDTVIIVRKSSTERSGTPAIDLRLGKTSDIIKLKINGLDFLHVDGERNITLEFKNMTLKGKVVDASAVTDDFVLP